MRGEMTQVWKVPKATIDTTENEVGISDSHYWLLPQQPILPVKGVFDKGNVTFTAHECC